MKTKYENIYHKIKKLNIDDFYKANKISYVMQIKNPYS